MSILGENTLSLLIPAAAMAVSAIAIVGAGALRPAAVSGPSRVPQGVRLWHLLMVAGCGVFVWIFVQQVFVSAKMSPARSTAAAPATMDLSRFSPGDWAFIATVPALAGAIALWVGDRAVGGPELIECLGFRQRALPRGIAQGIWGAVAILPPMYLVMFLTQWVYDRLHFSHPAEHQLLTVMGEAHARSTRALLILGATVAAPLWEEYLFRGHVQTILRALFVRLSTPRRPPLAQNIGGFPVAAPQDQVLPLADAVEPPRVWQTWLAIIITSVGFAMVHPMWMWPPIFVLALGLGYTYERTGNLWTSMTIHCLFNSASTYLYLSGINGP
ncbi:MAG TPA: CPBP family intramembrane glutamic endopeptidase [Tepidisphaeraceae bacterium]|jgi:membrane protease YdiL (CAAX protease family)|nr:CPBP family intramembrane glutamic endopeptidase [Tepidisphaeraceae bacterium]